MTTPVRRLVLWDIDHTLLETGSVGTAAFRSAFETVTGRPMSTMADPTGQTEPTIFLRTLREHGLPEEDDAFRLFAQAQADAYRRFADDMRHRGRVLPGVPDALRACQREPAIAQSVLSGNTRAAASVKLDIFDLTQHLDLDIGAYGDDEPERPRLVPIAQKRAAEKYGHLYAPEEIVLIGDTPADVHTGHANGTRVIGVATGRTTATELRDAGADTVLDDLTGTADLIAAILGT